MKGFLHTIRKLPRRLSKKTASLSRKRAFLLVALLVGVALPVAVYAWTIYPSMWYSTVYTGGYTYVSWSAPSSDYCALKGPVPISGETCYPPTYMFGILMNPGYCGYRVNGTSGSAYTGPINGPTTYTLSCINESGGLGSSVGSGSASITVYPATRTATTLNYFYASPSSIPYNSNATLYYSGNRGTDGYGLYLGGYGYLSGWSGSIARGPLTANTTYGIYTVDNYYGWVGPWNTTVSVVSAPVSADATPTTQTVSVGQSATISFHADSTQAPTQCQINNYNDTLALLNVAGCSTAQGRTFSTGVLNTPGTYSYKFYYYQGSAWTLAKTVTVTVNPIAPTPAISANPTTVGSGGTSALSWSATNLAAGQCTLTAPSSGSVATDFGSITSGTKTVNYYSENTVVNGWVYSIGGYNGSAYVTTVIKAPASSDLTVASNWSAAGSIPGTAAIFDKPLLIGSNLWSFGGVAPGASAWSSTICYVPVGTGTLGTWSCPASLPTGAAQGYSDPVIIGDYIYRFGGYNNTTYAGPVAAVARAPLSSPSSWTNYTNVLPQASGMYSHAVAVIGGYVYLLGGWNGTSYLNTIYRASIDSDLTVRANWTSGGVLPLTANSIEVAVDGNYAYLIGGYTGGAAASSIYKIPLATLAAGGVTAGSWSSAGTLPIGLNRTESVIVNDKLYLMGGWQNGVYVNKIFSLPFNDGLPYTTPANLPWHTTGGTNQAVTWPITSNTTYALQCTNSAGSGSASATVTIPDACADISGFQPSSWDTSPPSGCQAGPQCVPAGYTYNGSACVPSIATLNEFSGPARVRRGSTATLTYTIATPPPSCSITGTNGYASGPIAPVDGVQGSVTTNAITNNTVFTLTCGPVSRTATVGITPEFQEI